jgi:hypothetical protein
MAGHRSLALEPAGYSPGIPVAPLHARLQADLKQVQDWLDRKDFLSAGQTAQSMSALAQLYHFYSTDTGWQRRTSDLNAAFDRLFAAARKKSAEDCATSLKECTTLLDDLAKNPPAGERLSDAKFRPSGSLKTWMKLLSVARVDARTASSTKETEQFALLLAEEANAVAYLRQDEQWKQDFAAIKQVAGKAAQQASADDLPAARQTLREIQQRCEACHERGRK